MNKYLYELEVFSTNDDGDAIHKVGSISSYSEEGLLEDLRKIDHAIRDYESDQEARAQMEYDRQREEGEV